jgi:CspA family cold shock protein
MATGTVKWFSVAKKYGFVTPDEGGKDVFVHMTVLAAAKIAYLDDGTRVSFDLDENTSKLSAVNLAVLAVDSSESAAS